MVPNLSTFAWTSYTATNCTKIRKHQKERKRDKVIGPDAQDPHRQASHGSTYVDFLQAWAQATRVDGTVIVLYSGNHELVCVRHRASQTLYVWN